LANAADAALAADAATASALSADAVSVSDEPAVVVSAVVESVVAPFAEAVPAVAELAADWPAAAEFEADWPAGDVFEVGVAEGLFDDPFAVGAELEALESGADDFEPLALFAASIEKTSVLEELEALLALVLRVVVDDRGADEAPISSATGHQSIHPCPLRAFVRFLLFFAVERALFLCPEALDHRADGFGALSCALPCVELAITLNARSHHHLGLLPDGLFEARKECLIVARHRAIHA
jgi:hypothetical protein